MEPHFFTNKVVGIISALLGVAGLTVFWIPPKLRGKQGIAVGILIGGVASIMSVLFGEIAITYFKLDPFDIEVRMAVNGAIGIVSLPLMGWLSNFFEKRSGKDIVQIANELRGKSTPNSSEEETTS